MTFVHSDNTNTSHLVISKKWLSWVYLKKTSSTVTPRNNHKKTVHC